jgi:hypothetical protein
MGLLNYRFPLLIVLLFSASALHAQEFIGYVKKFDTSAVAVFQAKVEITESNKPVTVVKTYFDGSYKFTPGKSRTFTLHITYPGYTDTTFTISSDKKGIPSPASVTCILRKDGMRLLGTIKSKEEDFPIKGATISVKNIMTRKEDRVTTDIDGYYNVKLEYETNYRVSIDKRSAGVINRFRDTAFYISTVGFNQPLDYRLDIALEPSTETITPYSDYRPVASKATKPVVEVKAATDSAVVTDTLPMADTAIVQQQKDTLDRETQTAATDSAVVTDTLPTTATAIVQQQKDTLDRETQTAEQLKAELEKLKKELAEVKLKNLQSNAEEPVTTQKKKKGRRNRKQYVDYTEVVVIRDHAPETKSPRQIKRENRKKKKQETKP